jgi:hypothetical protein
MVGSPACCLASYWFANAFLCLFVALLSIFAIA